MQHHNKAESPCINCNYDKTGFCNNRFECQLYQSFLDGDDVQGLESIGHLNLELERAGLLDAKTRANIIF